MSFGIYALPRQKSRSLHDYLVAAAHAQFPSHSSRRLARVFDLLSTRRTIDDGWVERSEIAKFWPASRSRVGLEESKRQSGTITNAMADLTQQISRRLAWCLPHFTIKLEADPPNRAIRYRLTIVRRESPWDFQREEAPNTLPLTFAYRFAGDAKHTIPVRTWAIVSRDRTLEIEAVREPPKAEWVPTSHRRKYEAARDTFFASESQRVREAGLGDLHPSDLWGIKDLQVAEDSHGMSVRIFTEKTTYPDLHFLKRKMDEPFPALRKHGSFRDWLQLEPEPRTLFCPARDALCVDVLILAKHPEATVLVAKQKAPLGAGKWEASASGAACAAHFNVSDDRPDLKNQVAGVVHREVGLKIDIDQIRWLGLARGLLASSSTAVLALVETDLTAKQALQKFAQRRDKHDIETLVPVSLKRMREWLSGIPPKDRGEFLELILALAAINQGLAESC